MFQITKSYLKFLYNSKNQHGVHSPFVFNLVTKCFYDRTNYQEYKVLKLYRNLLLENQSNSDVTEFGAGSKTFRSNIKLLKLIAKTAGISSKRAKLLFRLVQYFKPNTVLEIGTSLGLGTAALFLGNEKAKITTLEGCTKTLAYAKKLFRISNFKLPKVNFINTEFSAYLKTINQNSATIDLIYFDGNHSQKATLNYFEHLLPTTTNNSVWIFDDIHSNSEMENAWKIIKNHPKVSLTIDTFAWGLVFFRSEQEKQHFVIRV